MMDTYQINCNSSVRCRSCFYEAQGALIGPYVIYSGKNLLPGEIDSGNWELSYFLSMSCRKKKDFIFYERPKITRNGQEVSVEEILDKSCYMDKLDPLFATKQTVRKLIEKGVKKNRLSLTAIEIQTLFQLDQERLDRPVCQVGNECFRAMAAIGVAAGREWFCFPWLSHMQVERCGKQLSYAVDKLEQLKKNIIFPCGEMSTKHNGASFIIQHRNDRCFF